MTKLIPPWAWALLLVAAIAAVFWAGYHQGGLKGAATLAEAQALWQAREAVYQANQVTAVRNAADAERALTACQAGNTAVIAAGKAATEACDRALAAASDARARLAALQAAQDAEPRPTDAATALVTLAAHIADVNGVLP
jgi:hypothetical protein